MSTIEHFPLSFDQTKVSSILQAIPMEQKDTHETVEENMYIPELEDGGMEEIWKGSCVISICPFIQPSQHHVTHNNNNNTARSLPNVHMARKLVMHSSCSGQDNAVVSLHHDAYH